MSDDLKADHTEELRNLCQSLEDTLSDATLIIDRQEDRIEELEAKLSEIEALLAKAVEASVEAVWAEYTDSVESKWTFRKEHIQNAILRTLAELKGEQP